MIALRNAGKFLLMGHGFAVQLRVIDEILTLSDRIEVMYMGRVVETFENSGNLLKETIGRRMLGL